MVRALGASSAIGALGYALSILGLGFAAAAGLSGRYSIAILLRCSCFTGIRVVGSCTLTIATNGLAARVLGAIVRKQTGSKEHTYHH